MYNEEEKIDKIKNGIEETRKYVIEEIEKIKTSILEKFEKMKDNLLAQLEKLEKDFIEDLLTKSDEYEKNEIKKNYFDKLRLFKEENTNFEKLFDLTKEFYKILNEENLSRKFDSNQVLEMCKVTNNKKKLEFQDLFKVQNTKN